MVALHFHRLPSSFLTAVPLLHSAFASFEPHFRWFISLGYLISEISNTWLSLNLFFLVITVHSVVDWYRIYAAKALKRWLNDQVLRMYSLLSYVFQNPNLDRTNLSCSSLRWAGCSDVQVHKIKVSEPLSVPFKIPLHLSLQIPVQKAPLQVESILWRFVLSK